MTAPTSAAATGAVGTDIEQLSGGELGHGDLRPAAVSEAETEVLIG